MTTQASQADAVGAPVSPRFHPRSRLVSRLGLLLGGATLLLAVLLGGAAWLSYTAMRAHAEDQARAVVRLVGREARSIIDAADLTLRQMVDLAQATDWSDQRAVTDVAEKLRLFRGLTPTAFRLFIFGPDGTLRATSAEDVPPTVTAGDRDYFRAQVSEDAGLYFSEPTAAKIDSTPIFVLSRRINTGDGGFGGIVSLSFEPEVIAAFYRSLQAMDGAAFAWVRADGMTLVREPNPTPGSLSAARMPPPPELLPAGEADGAPYVSPFDRERRTAFVRPVGNHPLYVVLGIADDAIMRAWLNGTWPYFCFALLALVGLGFASYRALSWAHAEDLYRGELARLTRQLRATNRDLEARVADRTTELSDALTQKEMLLQELSHRVKNTLATVQSIAAHTLRPGTPASATQESFIARLRALAQAHNLLSQTEWRGADLRDVIEVELAPHLGNPGENRVQLDGPALHVDARAALTFGMAFHELATNAAKYGALSASDGRVDVFWTTREVPSGRTLMIEWVERGGPAVEPPTRKGFGSILIERSIAHELDGTVTVAFAPEGLRCVVEVPLPASRPDNDARI